MILPISNEGGAAIRSHLLHFSLASVRLFSVPFLLASAISGKKCSSKEAACFDFSSSVFQFFICRVKYLGTSGVALRALP